MRKLSHLLASLAFFGWTAAANAALMHDEFFYFPGDGKTPGSITKNTPPLSLLSPFAVTQKTGGGLCISPCWGIAAMPATKPGIHFAGSTTTGGGQSNPPGGGDPFDPEVITEEVFEEGPGDPPPVEEVIGQENELPPGDGGEEGEGGAPGGGDPVNTGENCSAQSANCTAGTADSTPVPLPSTLLLLGLGLFGLARSRRRH